MRFRAHASFPLALALCLQAHAARAEPGLPVELIWRAPEGCPDAESVLHELDRITRVQPGRTLPALEAHGSITRGHDSYRLSLEVRQGPYVRVSSFESPTCSPLRGAAALVLVLAWGDGVLVSTMASHAVAADRSAQAPEAPAPEPLIPKPAKDAPDLRGRAPQAPTPIGYTPWLGAAISSGVAGARAVGADFGLGLGGKHWAAFARGNIVPWQVASVRGTVSAELGSSLGSVGGCARAGARGARFDACLAFEAGQIRARSLGSVQDGAVRSTFLAVTPSVSLLVPLASRFALRAEAALALPFASPRYDVAPYGTLYAASRFAPRLALGLAVTLF